jgi:hypothetical protein
MLKNGNDAEGRRENIEQPSKRRRQIIRLSRTLVICQRQFC